MATAHALFVEYTALLFGKGRRLYRIYLPQWWAIGNVPRHSPPYIITVRIMSTHSGTLFCSMAVHKQSSIAQAQPWRVPVLLYMGHMPYLLIFFFIPCPLYKKFEFMGSISGNISHNCATTAYSPDSVFDFIIEPVEASEENGEKKHPSVSEASDRESPVS